MGEGVARFVVVVVVIAWFATTVILPVAVKGYVAPPELSTPMGIIVGGAAAFVFAKRGENGRKKKKNG